MKDRGRLREVTRTASRKPAAQIADSQRKEWSGQCHTAPTRDEQRRHGCERRGEYLWLDTRFHSVETAIEKMSFCIDDLHWRGGTSKLKML